MNRKLTATFALFLFIFSLSLTPQASAYEGTTGDYFREIGAKLGRGLVNTLSSPAGIPCGVSKEIKEGDNNVVDFFMGLGKGTGSFGRRLLSGVTEFATFLIPMDGEINPICTE